MTTPRNKGSGIPALAKLHFIGAGRALGYQLELGEGSKSDSRKERKNMPECISTDDREFESTRKKRRRTARLTGVSKLRKAANARERARVKTLNERIVQLKDILPMSDKAVKPTKTDIIWMAAEYIADLREMLRSADTRVGQEEYWSIENNSSAEESAHLGPSLVRSVNVLSPVGSVEGLSAVRSADELSPSESAEESTADLESLMNIDIEDLITLREDQWVLFGEQQFYCCENFGNICPN
ncbi:uncharacterized protein LOC116619576 [Nematostella vectensis]|uniref:uncharacterized protein LOC116619576 n=1 Tax=Nematostella vectensis TaxID=45351 RepID=UPI0020776825|nr:uncharacterized protein LOC116619576 [Nematostella vectensis]